MTRGAKAENRRARVLPALCAATPQALSLAGNPISDPLELQILAKCPSLVEARPECPFLFPPFCRPMYLIHPAVSCDDRGCIAEFHKAFQLFNSISRRES